MKRSALYLLGALAAIGLAAPSFGAISISASLNASPATGYTSYTIYLDGASSSGVGMDFVKFSTTSGTWNSVLAYDDQGDPGIKTSTLDYFQYASQTGAYVDTTNTRLLNMTDAAKDTHFLFVVGMPFVDPLNTTGLPSPAITDAQKTAINVGGTFTDGTRALQFSGGTLAVTAGLLSSHIPIAQLVVPDAVANSIAYDVLITGDVNHLTGTVSTAPAGDVNEIVLSTVASHNAANTYGAAVGTVAVTSGDGGAHWGSNKLAINGTDQKKGNANVTWTGGTPAGPVWVMLYTTGTDANFASTVAGSNVQVFTAASHAGTDWDKLATMYGTSFNSGTFNYLIEYTGAGAAGAGTFYWDLNGATPISFGITGLAIVPEPASLGLLALGALGLMARRRK